MNSLVISATYSSIPVGKVVHYHDCHQILYITKGTAIINVEGKEYRASSGTLVLISHLEQHQIIVESEHYCRYSLHISPLLSNRNEDDYYLFSALINRPENFHHAINVLKSNIEFEFLFQRITDEFKNKKALSGQMMDLLLYDLLIHLYRCEPELFCNINPQISKVVRQIQSRFENNYRDDYSLSQLAKDYHLSVYHLSHIYKRTTGYSIMGHLQSYRIAAAKSYLAKTNMEISEIINACGFSDSSNFSRTFKNSTGLTPTQYRRHFFIKK